MKSIVLKENDEIEVKKYLQKFLNYIDVAPKTVETYRIALNQFINYLYSKDIKNPTREDIIDFREHLKETTKPTTVNSYLIAIRNLYDYLEYEGITKNIAKNIKGIKLEQRHLKRGLSVEEIHDVISCCKDLREKLIIKLMISCGLRGNEVVNIRLEDFYDDKGITMLQVLGKGRNGLKQDSVKIDTRLLEMIKEYVEKYNVSDYLFYSTSNHNKNGKITSKTIRYIVTNIFKKANLDMERISPHSTRHSTCELLLENGMPIQEVSEFMRHKNISTTMIYSKELDKRNTQAPSIIGDVLF
jgi:integrase/recombinase XerC